MVAAAGDRAQRCDGESSVANLEGSAGLHPEALLDETAGLVSELASRHRAEEVYLAKGRFLPCRFLRFLLDHWFWTLIRDDKDLLDF